MEWWIIAFFKILLINIILSGDNAIVIAMASKNLPEQQRRLAIFWGAFGAIALRIVLTFIAISLFKIPYLTAIGALLLLWIAVKLITEEEDHANIKAPKHIGNVVMTIIVADFVMSLDNVIAITAVADGHIWLIVLGLLLSIPLIVWGSNIILKLIEKFPVLIYIGSAILGFTAGEMLLHEQKLTDLFGQIKHLSDYLLPTMMAFTVVCLGWLLNKMKMLYEGN